MGVAPETVAATSLPPREAISFFAGKLNTATTHWTDLWRDAHSRGFMVAGAATEALVGDFRDAVTKALEQGTTLAEFRADFDGIVSRHGWLHNGSAAWRSRLIYDVNLSMAYSAGRWDQQTRPENLAAFPYLQYVHSGAAHPRKQHLAWNGLTLRADDPWWSTHYPPNGWRCGCRARSRSGRDLARQGKTGPDAAPAVEMRSWTNPRTGETNQVPEGIDPGFDYNPGAAWKRNALPPIPTNASFTPPPGWMPEPPPIPAPSSRPAAAQPARIRTEVVRSPPTDAVRRADAALAEGYAAWGASLDEAESGALATYRSTAGLAFNRVLRGEAEATPALTVAIARLSAAIGRATAPVAIRAFRGVSAGEAAALGPAGSTGRFPAFLSTSIDRLVAADFARRHAGRVVEVLVPAGRRGAAYVQPFPQRRPVQYEVLIAPGARYRVVSRTKARLVMELLDVGPSA